MQKQHIYKRYRLFLGLLLFYAYTSYAQYPYVFNYSAGNTNGIVSNNLMFRIKQDVDSCMVFASDDGFIRYNGFEFIKYSASSPNKEHQLPINRVFDIFTHNSFSWIVSPLKDKTLYYFDKTHKIHSLKIQKLDQYSADFENVVAIILYPLSKDSFIVVATSNRHKVVLIEQKGSNPPKQIPIPKNFYYPFERVDINYGNCIMDTVNHFIGAYIQNKWVKIPYNNIGSYVENSKNLLVSDKTIILNLPKFKNKAGAMVISFDVKQKKEIARKYLPYGYVIDFLPDKNLLLYSNENKILDKYLREVQVNYLSKEKMNRINYIFNDKHENLWYLGRGDTQINVILKAGISANAKYWKSEDGIRKMVQDDKGNIWLFSGGGDILCYHNNRIDTVKLNLPYHRYPINVAVRGNELWLGSPIDERLVRLWIPKLKFNQVNTIIDLNSAGNNTLGNDDNWWTFPKGMSQTAHYQLDLFIKHIEVLQNNDLLLATVLEPAVLSTKHKNLITLQQINNQGNSLMYCNHIDKEGNLWIGRGTGLFLGKKHIDALPRIKINFIKEYPNDKLLVATEGEGLWIYDKKQDKAQLIPHTAQTKVYDLSIENDGIWIASDKGLSFKKNDGQALFYGFQAGLSSLIINGLVSNDSLIFLATNNGFMALNKKLFKNNYLKPSELNFEYAKLADKDLLVNNLHNHFSYQENYLSVELKDKTFNFNLQDKKYEFHLILNDNEILKDTSFSFESKQTFPSLAPGNYKFYVVRKGLDGQNYGKSPTIQFSISPPFWKSWQAITLFFISIISTLIWYFHRQRSIAIKINELEMEALSSQINPHFLGNSLTAIGAVVLSEKDSFKAYSYLVSFSSMVRQFMLSSVKRFFLIENEIILLENYLKIESLRFKNFDYVIDNKLPSSTTIPAGMIQPFVENALKHGILSNNLDNRGLIKINFKKNKNVITCCIEDNGKGIEAGKKESTKKTTRTSVSLVNIQRRIELLNNSKFYKKANLLIQDKSTISNETGTIVIITLIEK